MICRVGLALVLSLFLVSHHVAAKTAAAISDLESTQAIGSRALRPEAPDRPAQPVILLAQSMSRADAFAASKELNTVDGWNAYLKQYPDGFRADLARAYIKKLLRGDSSRTVSDRTKPAKPRYLRTRNAAIEGHDTKQLFDRNVEQCLLACTNETEFVCKSVDYYKGRNICDLSDTRATDVGGLRDDYAGNPYDHYERVMTGLSSQPDLSRTVADMICENGSIRGGTCRCSARQERVRNAKNDYSCKQSNSADAETTDTKKTVQIVCKRGYISGGKCRCNSSRTRVKTGYRRYSCVRKKSVAKKKPWEKYKKPWTRKDCGSLIPGCIRKCNKGDDNCKLNCNQMCSGA